MPLVKKNEVTIVKKINYKVMHMNWVKQKVMQMNIFEYPTHHYTYIQLLFLKAYIRLLVLL